MNKVDALNAADIVFQLPTLGRGTSRQVRIDNAKTVAKLFILKNPRLEAYFANIFAQKVIDLYEKGYELHNKAISEIPDAELSGNHDTLYNIVNSLIENTREYLTAIGNIVGRRDLDADWVGDLGSKISGIRRTNTTSNLALQAMRMTIPTALSAARIELPQDLSFVSYSEGYHTYLNSNVQVDPSTFLAPGDKLGSAVITKIRNKTIYTDSEISPSEKSLTPVEAVGISVSEPLTQYLDNKMGPNYPRLVAKYLISDNFLYKVDESSEYLRIKSVWKMTANTVIEPSIVKSYSRLGREGYKNLKALLATYGCSFFIEGLIESGTSYLNFKDIDPEYTAFVASYVLNKGELV